MTVEFDTDFDRNDFGALDKRDLEFAIWNGRTVSVLVESLKPLCFEEMSKWNHHPDKFGSSPLMTRCTVRIEREEDGVIYRGHIEVEYERDNQDESPENKTEDAPEYRDRDK